MDEIEIEPITLSKAIEEVFDPYDSVQREVEDRIFLEHINDLQAYGD